MLLRSVVRIALAVPFLASFSLAACSSDDPAPAAAPLTAGPAVDQLPAKLAAVICEVATPCLGPTLPLFLRGEDCVTLYTNTLTDGDIGATARLVMEGKLVYDSSKVQACLDAYRAGGCDIIDSRGPDVCHQIFNGKGAVGASCTVGAECGLDLFCEASVGCPGTCAARKEAGVACTSDEGCVDTLACLRNVCTARLGEGAACGGGVAGDCKVGLLCIGEDNDQKTAGICRNQAAIFTAPIGSACDLTNGPYCAVGGACQFESVTAGKASFVCVAPVGSGKPCKIAFPDACPQDEHCPVGLNPQPAVLEATCTKRIAAGQSCASRNASCEPYSICDGGICRARGRVGDACESSGGCFSGLCKAKVCAEGLACEPKTN